MDNIYLNQHQSFAFTHKVEPLSFIIDDDLVNQWVKKYNLSTHKTKDFSVEFGENRYRVHLFHSISGWNAALRLLPSQIIPFTDLNIEEQEVMSICSGTGLVLFCGPTSAGKSTTMCTVIDTLLQSNKLGVAISIEDPVEYLHNDQTIFQREVGTDVESFAHGLIDAVRATPRTIIIGEIRDQETAIEAIKAGLNGHRVFATLHAVSIKEAISRIWAFVGEEFSGLLVQSLQGIFVQKLIRTEKKTYCIYESIKADNKVKNVLSSIFDRGSGATLNLLNHNQYEQKRVSLQDKEKELFGRKVIQP